jgi:hypothetical protein
MAQVVHALQFLAGVGLVKIERVMGIVNRGHWNGFVSKSVDVSRLIRIWAAPFGATQIEQ